MLVSSLHEIITPENYKFFKGVSAMDKITHQVRAEHWARILNECLNSGMSKTAWCRVNILALQYRDSGKLSTDVPDVDTGIDWLVYLAQYSQQCQAQSHFVVRSRLDTVENTEIMAGSNQAFYCGTLRPDCLSIPGGFTPQFRRLETGVPM